MEKEAKAAAASNWLANPAMPWVVAGLAAFVVLWLAPNLLSRLWNKGGETLTGAADDVTDAFGHTSAQLSTIVGTAPNEVPLSQQTPRQVLGGVLAGGTSRVWSDLTDLF